MDHLQELSAHSPTVRCALNMAALEQLTEEERGRLAYRSLLGFRHVLLKQLLARRENWPLSRVAWPERDAAAQAHVLRRLHTEVERMEEALASLVGTDEQVAA